MLRKTVIALLAAVSLTVLAPGVASARGGFGGGGWHGGGGGGWHGGGGGWHGGGGGWHGGGMAFRSMPMGGAVYRSAAIGGVYRNAAVGQIYRSAAFGGPHFVPGFRHGFHRRAFVGGIGVVGPYGYYDDSYPAYGYPDQVYYDDNYVEGGCALVRQQVPTPFGWQIRTVQVCQ